MPLFYWLAIPLLAAATWAVAGLLLRLRHSYRLCLSLAIPAAFAFTLSWMRYLSTRGPVPTVWDVVFFIVSLAFGIFAVLLATPAWFVMEERLGWRADREGGSD